MIATKIEISTKALRGGRHVNGVWEPYGQVIARLYVAQPDGEVAEEIAARLRAAPALDGESWAVEVQGRGEVPEE